MTASGSRAVYEGASAHAIQRHYDVDNDFYALWLDATRSYSCALFEDSADTLQNAQLRKLDYIAREALAPGSRRVLDIGCGWGGMLERLKHTHGVRETVGLTLSQRQLEYVEARFGDAHTVRLESWHAHEPSELYAAIVSIGAFEHFARPDMSREARVLAYRQFFVRCWQWLEPGAGMCLQTICYDLADRSELSPFFRDWVFPESDLPRVEEILEAVRGLFHLVRLRNDPDHYAETCRRWRRQLRARSTEAAQLVGAAVFENFSKYLALSTLSFQMRKTGLLRITLRRADRAAGVPA
jgi:cyclopropane-fatty-acyl-phospholipid synthase